MATVLIVDDDSDIRGLLHLILEELGHQVLTADTGAAALMQVRNHPPDLLITDLMMPVLDGIGLIVALRSDPTYASIPIVIMTAGAVTSAVMASLPPVQGIIGKPFSLSAIETLVYDLVEER